MPVLKGGTGLPLLYKMSKQTTSRAQVRTRLVVIGKNDDLTTRVIDGTRET